MRRPYSRLAAACALAVATAALAASSAAAGGNPNAPGQQKKDEAAPPAQTQAPAPAQQQATTQAQAQPAEQHGNSANAPGHASSSSSSSTSTSASTQAGVKPSSSTTHWTHCKTGGSASATTCTSSDNGHTPQTGSDVSKRYGNGKTAAQIAVSRGGTNVQLTGPGNSQPHKVSVCGKPNNKSGGVDVHAVKSYSNANCSSTKEEAKPPTAPCGFVVVAVTDNATVHGHGKGLVHNKHVTESTHYVLRADNSQVCGTATTVTLPGTTTTLPGSTTTVGSTTTAGSTTTVGSTTTAGSTATQQVVTTAGTTTTSGSSAVAGQSVTKSSSGVLGASVTLKPKKAPAGHGVLGTVTHVASGSLPFTGFPVWVAVLVAFALIGVGVAIRRRGSATL